MANKHLCPVCGYEMEDPPRDYNICPSCGTEFGNDDALATQVQLRAEWLRNGPRWWSPVDPEPENWDPQTQVSNVLSGAALAVVFRWQHRSEGWESPAGLSHLISGNPQQELGFFRAKPSGIYAAGH